MVSPWTQRRLQRLYDRYNAKYWDGALPTHAVVLGPCDALGRCDPRRKLVTIDAAIHRSDRAVRSTLLHEMCHVATGQGGHDSHFLEELERLLADGARVEVGIAETGGALFLEAVPARFVRCRKRIKREMATAQRALAAQAREGHVENLTLAMVEGEFEDAARDGATWTEALFEIGRRCGLVDVDTLPVPGREEWVAKAGRVFRRVKREIAADRRAV